MIEGAYFDGKTSRSHPARMTAMGGQASIRLTAAGEVKFQGALTDLRISSRLANVQRSLRFDSGQLFMTADNDGIDRILRDQGRKQGLVHRLEARLVTAVAAAIGTLLIAAFTFVYALPFMANAIAERAPQGAVNLLGDGWMRILDATILETSELPPEKQSRVARLFQPVLKEHADLNPTLHFRASFAPNALALLDGSIIFTDELIEMASDDELVAILLHELGHLKHRHLLKRVLQQSTIALIVVMVTGDVGTASEFLGATTMLASLSYSRDFEREADVFALEGLLNEGIDPASLGSILDRLTSAKIEIKVSMPQADPPESTNTEGGQAMEGEANEAAEDEPKTGGEIKIIRKDEAGSQWPFGRRESVLDYLSTHPPTPERVELAWKYQQRWREMQEPSEE